MAFELGVYSFGEITPDPVTGAVPTARRRLRDYVEQARLADEVGLDVFAIGEHHRGDFAVSATAVVLAAMAEHTENIRLSSSVTVLSSEDPVRVFQQYATLDLLSGGRAEIIAGRGSYVESFPLFGYDLADYDALFAEKLDLLLALRENNPVTWSGRFRPALTDADVAPRPLQERLPIWVAVGGTPASVVRAGTLGLPLALAIIGGPLARFQPFARLYRRAAQEAGHDPATLPVSINSPGFVAPTSQAARELSYPYFDRGMLENFHERGHGFHTPREAYDAQSSPPGALVVGSPQEIVDKILHQHELFGHQRLLIQLAFGGVPQKETLRAIELLGTEVAPVVRRELGDAA
ncbi:LLM class flavin-dependent oxidoreductase [Prauserella cavernicola]|uniref:LLM class flavin-dependent oxidoreductase n=1 Tax=Prauserella cavernicola TaxID=2800127 RepID=A0A934QUU7_9PSEU|nr:LLM class flavin-dependent oxidoreductase [Prauserella cavernicola]MBK1786736.1 LLM class flavin-dependent oxidoreductase [Prauserella cavernicola]